MNKDDFEKILDTVCTALTVECRTEGKIDNALAFENRVREVLDPFFGDDEPKIDFNPSVTAFPDIALGKFGVEVKHTKKDSWRSTANSILQSTRDENIAHIYIVYGKMGGEPTVAWDRYEDCVVHARVSHSPRFEVSINAKESLFDKMGVTYEEFSSLSVEGKMRHVRRYYARHVAKPSKHGSRPNLWWLGDEHLTLDEPTLFD